MPSSHKVWAGFAIEVAPRDASPRRIERDVSRCAHCGVGWVNGAVYLTHDGKPVARGFCRNHMATTCGAPGCATECVPLEDGGTGLDKSYLNRGDLLLNANGLPAAICCSHCRRWYQPPLPVPGATRERCWVCNSLLCGKCEVSCTGH